MAEEGQPPDMGGLEAAEVELHQAMVAIAEEEDITEAAEAEAAGPRMQSILRAAREEMAEHMAEAEVEEALPIQDLAEAVENPAHTREDPSTLQAEAEEAEEDIAQQDLQGPLHLAGMEALDIAPMDWV